MERNLARAKEKSWTTENGTFVLSVRDGRVILDTEESFVSVNAQVDSGAGLRNRPLPATGEFRCKGTADITDTLYKILYSDVLRDEYRLTSLLDMDIFENAECEKTADGYLVTLPLRYSYNPEGQVVEMLPLPGVQHIKVSFLVRWDAPEKTRKGKYGHGGRIHDEEFTVAVGKGVPDFYKRQLKKAVRRYNWEGRTHIKLVYDVPEIDASCSAAASYDVLATDVSVYSVPGFFRLNIGANTTPDRRETRHKFRMALDYLTESDIRVIPD